MFDIDSLLKQLYGEVSRAGGNVDANSPGEMVRSSLAGQMPGMARPPMSLSGAPVAPVERSSMPTVAASAPPMAAPMNVGAPAPAAPQPQANQPPLTSFLGNLASGIERGGGILSGISNVMDNPAKERFALAEKARTEQQASAVANQTVQALIEAGAPPAIAQATIGNPILAKQAIDAYIKPNDPNAALNRRKTEAEIAKLEQEAKGGGESGQPAGLLSKGYRYNRETGTMEAVPGGPADQKQVAKQQGDKTALDYTFTGMDRLASSVNALLQNDRGLGRITGAMSVLPNIPGGDAANAQAQLETLKAQVAFQTLQDMRNASKTGGALGQVTERELAMLQNALVPLEQAQSYDQFKKAMQDILKFTEESKARVRSAYDRIYAGGEQGQQGAPDNDLKAKYGLE